MSLDLCLIISILDSKKIDFEKSSIADIFSPNLSFRKPKNILEEIIWEKDIEVEIARKKVSLEDLKKKIKDLPKTKDFLQALRNSKSKPALISEIKKASPSTVAIQKTVVQQQQ